MSERPSIGNNLARYLERLDRPRSSSESLVATDRKVPPLPDARALLTQLGDSIDRMPNGEGIKPLFEQVRGHVEALFPVAGDVSLDEKAHSAHKERLEELFQTLEGVLYACSLPAR